MSVKEFVQSAIADNKVAFFSKSWCPYCGKSKALFANEFPDVEIKVFELDKMDDGSDIQAYLKTISDQSSVPNIYIDGKHIGGNDKIQSLFKEGKLVKLLN